MGCPEQKVRVQHLGVEVRRIPFEPRQWRPGEPLRVLIAASFREKKGIPYALDALGRIAKAVPLKVTIIGDAASDAESLSEKEKILATIKRNQLGSSVRMLGFQSHKVLIDQALLHHVFLSPSVTAADGDTEGGAPVTIIEMAASGMAIVSTVHCDIPNVIISGETGWLARERDVEGLVNGIFWFLHTPDWRGVLKKAREHIAMQFDVPLQAQRLSKHYEAVLRQ
jgi:colanic acid/amylovoran biosynthesis glycosyltransferase